jgi:hypothetical protein
VVAGLGAAPAGRVGSGSNPAGFNAIAVDAASIAGKVEATPALVPVAVGIGYPANHLDNLGVVGVAAVGAKLQPLGAVVGLAGKCEGHVFRVGVEVFASDKSIETCQEHSAQSTR